MLNKHIIIAASLLLMSVFLGGCATTLGPVTSSEIDRAINNDLPAGHAAIVYTNAAEWYPPAFAIGTGVLVLTEDHLYFLIWDNDAARYEVPFKIGYEKISNVTMGSYGLTKELVILAERENHLEYHKFKALKAGGSWVDNESTVRAYNMLSGRVPQ